MAAARDSWNRRVSSGRNSGHTRFPWSFGDQMRTAILPTHTLALFDAAVQQAADWLRRGAVVALPTETVYGLAANALDPVAVAKLYELKGRPAHNPIIVHVAGLELAQQCVTAWPGSAAQLAHQFWPGPLTLVLPRSRQIPDIVTAGGPTVGVRWPDHPLMQAVIRACGFPLAAPSANPANLVSPTTAEHVHKQFAGRLPLIVDGGAAGVGIESTVVDLTTLPWRVLRPGMISEEAIRAVGHPTSAPAADASGAASEHRGLRSPGQLPKHYAPKARLLVRTWHDTADLHQQLGALPFPRAKIQVIAHTRIPSDAGLAGVSVIPVDAAAYARAIYAELHRCDAAGVALIIVEALPAGPEWRGIVDRLNRAASD